MRPGKGRLEAINAFTANRNEGIPANGREKHTCGTLNRKPEREMCRIRK
jgi:hypothetical protein